MAINFLPILLLGAAAAVVVSSKKKTPAPATPTLDPATPTQDPARKPSGAGCPDRVAVTSAELHVLEKEATAVSGSDPVEAAAYVLKAVLPPECKIDNRTTIIDWHIAAFEDGGDFGVDSDQSAVELQFVHPIIIPDFFMFIILECMDEMGSPDSEFNIAQIWYESVMGRPFDYQAAKGRWHKAYWEAYDRAKGGF